MPYTPGIPVVTNAPASDAVLIQQNFQQIQNDFSVDHVPLATAPAGFHKQVSFFQTGASPYPVIANQAYEYQKFLALNARSYLEYQPSGPDQFPPGTPAIVPLSFKAYIVFVPTGIIIKKNFNCQAPTFAAFSYTINFNENMPDAFYTGIVTAVTNPNNNITVTSQSVNSIQITLSQLPVNYLLISVMVL